MFIASEKTQDRHGRRSLNALIKCVALSKARERGTSLQQTLDYVVTGLLLLCAAALVLLMLFQA